MDSVDERSDSVRSSGVLLKWTNYMTGWQARYFEIRHGIFAYYKSKAEKSAGCRGSITLKAARVQLTEDTRTEFSVRVGDDVVWYLKADTVQGRDRWVRRLTTDYDSDYSSRTHSRTPSSASSVAGPMKAEGHRLGKADLIATRIVELGGYRELCESQMAEIVEELERTLESMSADSPVTRQKLLTIKATHIAMLSNVDRILQLAAETAEHVPVHRSPSSISAPPPAHPPHASDGPRLNGKEKLARADSVRQNGFTSDDEECWHDANSDRASLREREEAAAASGDIEVMREAAGSSDESVKSPRHLPFGNFDEVAIAEDHPLRAEVDRLTKEQLEYALADAADPEMWTLFASDGDMKMYKKEVEQDGLPVDPLKALHSVKGTTALEFLHYFFHHTYKKDWDHTLEDMRLIESISADLFIIHQKHKTVWPAAPRESLFWSHLRRVDEWKSEGAHDCYIVCNKDVQRDDVPRGSSSAVRVGLTVSMICETHIHNPEKLPLSQLPRSAFTCKVIYVSSVHPGGWVPTSALRHVYKREYPKFLRTFTSYVLEKVKKDKRVAL